MRIPTKDGDVVVQLRETKGTTCFLASHGEAKMVIDGLNIYEQEYGKKFVANEYEHQDLINERIEDLANAAIRRNFDVRLKF